MLHKELDPHHSRDIFITEQMVVLQWPFRVILWV